MVEEVKFKVGNRVLLLGEDELAGETGKIVEIDEKYRPPRYLVRLSNDAAWGATEILCKASEIKLASLPELDFTLDEIAAAEDFIQRG
jgi:hypothetical protein